MQPFLVFGHRGSPLHAPENTIRSFAAAFDAGADGIETDLRLLSDRTAVLYHDDDFGEHEIESLTSSAIVEAGLAITLLRDLEPFTQRGTLVLEVKRSKWEEVLVQEVGSWPNIIIASFDHDLIAKVAQYRRDLQLGLTTFGRIVDFASYAARLGASWVFPAYRYVDAAMVADLHAAGIKVAPWTPNRPRDWECLRDAGCDGVITDFPDEAVQWRAAQPSSRL